MICLENMLGYFHFFKRKIPLFGGRVLTSNIANTYTGGFLFLNCWKGASCMWVMVFVNSVH